MWGPGDEATLRKRFKQAKAIGVSQVRLDWEWRQVESTRGTYNWQALDTLVRVAQAEKIELLPIVHYAPTWALRPSPSRMGSTKWHLPKMPSTTTHAFSRPPFSATDRWRGCPSTVHADCLLAGVERA